MVDTKKVAAYTGTRNLYPMMIPAVKSLLIHSDVDEIWLFIEDDGFPNSEGYRFPEDVVKIRNVSGQQYFREDGPNMRSKFTYMAMMRATFAKEFPELDEILSLDVDTIVNEDVSDLWNIPLGDKYYLAASREPSATKKHGYLYTNIGVCLYNLKKLRDGKCDEVIEALNDKQYDYLEQDAFNELCKGKIFNMNPTYNSTPFTKIVDNPKIVHYAGEKKWDTKQLVKKYGERPWDEVMKYRKWRFRK